MKIKSTIIFLLVALCFNMRAGVTTPVQGTMYNIINRSNSLSVGIDTVNASGSGLCQNPSSTVTQAFIFYYSGSGDSCYIQQVSTGMYLITTGDWNTSWIADPAAVTGTSHANFYLKAVDNDYVLIYSSKGLLGADANTDGTWLFSNKSGESTAAYQWSITEFVSSIDKTTLLAAITEATNFLNSTTAGTEPGNYPQAAYTALSDSINAAQTVYNNADATLVEITIAQQHLTAALAAYKEELILDIDTTPEEGTMYNIINNGAGYYLAYDTTNATTNARMFNPSSTTVEAFKFYYSGSGDSVYIKNVYTGKYLIASGSWNTAWVEDPSAVTGTNHANFYIEAIDDENVVIHTVKGLLGNGSSASDNTEGAYLYSNKTGTSVKYYQWKLVVFNIDKSKLLSAINTATAFLNATTAGNNVGEYPLSAYTAFSDSIAAAQAVYDNDNALADEITTAINNVTNALANYKNLVNPFIFIADQKYNVIHYSGYYLATVSDTSVKIATTDSSSTLNQFIFQATDSTGVYNIQQVASGKYVTKNSWNTGLYTDATSLNAQFMVYLVEGDYYKIKCIGTDTYLGTDGVTSGSSVYSDKDGTSTNHYWELKEYFNAAADFVTFNLAEQVKDAVINSNDTTITCTVAYLEDLSTLTPSFTVSDGAQVSSTTIIDFTLPVNYKVIAEDGISIKNWKVTVNKASNEAEITAFTVNGIVGNATIDASSFTIAAMVTSGTEITSLEPTITISDGATITPTGSKDFSSSVVYAVTSEDGSVTNDWTVTISVEQDTTSIDYTGASVTMSVFPNPVNDVLNININSSDNHKVNIKVINITGKVVLEQAINTNQNNSINFKDYPSGIYFISTPLGNKKVIKQ